MYSSVPPDISPRYNRNPRLIRRPHHLVPIQQ